MYNHYAQKRKELEVLAWPAVGEMRLISLNNPESGSYLQMINYDKLGKLLVIQY